MVLNVKSALNIFIAKKGTYATSNVRTKYKEKQRQGKIATRARKTIADLPKETT